MVPSLTLLNPQCSVEPSPETTRRLPVVRQLLLAKVTTAMSGMSRSSMTPSPLSSVSWPTDGVDITRVESGAWAQVHPSRGSVLHSTWMFQAVGGWGV